MGVTTRLLVSAPGEEWARCIGGITNILRLTLDSLFVVLLIGDAFRGRSGSCFLDGGVIVGRSVSLSSSPSDSMVAEGLGRGIGDIASYSGEGGNSESLK